MTVGELKTKLAKFPDDFKVVIDTSTDYEDYDEVSRLIPCEFDRRMVAKLAKMDSSANAVLLA